MNSKKRSLLKNTIILTVGKVCTQFINFILLPIYTLYLSTSEYGIVDLLTTYISLLVPVLTLQLEMAIFRFLIDSRGNNKEKSNIITNSSYILIIVMLIIAIIGYFIIRIFDIKFGFYIIVIVLVTMISNSLLQLSRGLGNNGFYSIGCIISAFLSITINLFLLVYCKYGIQSVFIATIIANIICSIYLFFKNKVYMYIRRSYINKTTIYKLIKYSYSLVPNGLVWWVINASDRTIISIVLGVSANGIYSVSNKFSNIINSLYSIFNMSWTESISLHIDDNDSYLKEIFNSMFNFICIMCALLISCMFIIFPFLINRQFIKSYDYIPILVIASLFNMLSSNIGSIYIANKETKRIAKTTIIASIINIVFNILFIQNVKLYAAAISTFISFLFLFLIRYLDINKSIDISLNHKDIYINMTLLLISFILYYVDSYLIRTLNLILLMRYIIHKYRDNIIICLNKIRNKKSDE